MASFEKHVRKELEKMTVLAVQAAGLSATQIRWPGIAWKAATVTEYVRFGFKVLVNDPATLGSQPRLNMSGSFSMDVFVPRGSGQDRIDDIIGRQASKDTPELGEGLLSQFPYAKAFPVDGVNVTFDLASPTAEPVDVDSWTYKAVNIHWRAWRSL